MDKSTAINAQAFEAHGCYCLVGSMPKTNRDVVNIIRSIFADLLPELQVNVTRPTSDDEFEIVIERQPNASHNRAGESDVD